MASIASLPQEVLQKYQLGSSANVSIVKRALIKKELIEIEAPRYHPGSGDESVATKGIESRRPAKV